MRIALINPPFNRIKRIYVPYVPLSLQYLAAAVKQQSHEVEIFNCDGPDKTIPKKKVLQNDKFQGQVDLIDALQNDDHEVWQEVIRYLRQYKPDVVGITATSPTFPGAKKIAHIVKKINPECITVMGGMHPTVCFEEVIQDEAVDFIVRGEGEETLCELVAALEKYGKAFIERHDICIKGIVYRKEAVCTVTPCRELIADIDYLPMPARDAVVNSFPMHVDKKSILTTRGCAYDCGYCSSSQMWKRKIRFRSLEKVIDEMKHMNQIYGIRLFEFKDETFTVDRERVVRFCSLVEQLDFPLSWSCTTRIDLVDRELIDLMGRAGCVHMSFGIESGSKEIGHKIGKVFSDDHVLDVCSYVKKRGILLTINLMIGLPFEREEDIRKTEMAMKKIRPHRVFIGVYVPLPRTALNSGDNECVIEGDNWK